MKTWLVLLAFSVITLFLSPALTIAQTNIAGDNHTVREEQEGKEVWEKLQAKQLECNTLADDQYGSLGEYFMGQYIGNTERHAIMNQMMISMMGEEGERQMHITLGKRSSGCDTNAAFPSGYGMPMMWWMMGLTGSPQVGGGGNPMMGQGWGGMMNGWGGFGIIGWLTMIIFWILIILGVVALIRYLGGTRQNSTDKDKTPLDILKERYARGEIDKKEFEEKKKDLA